MPTLPPELAIVLAGFATVVSHVLRDSKQSKWLNMLIAAIALAASTLAALWLTDSFISGDLRANIRLFLGMSIVIAGKEGYDLLKYLLDSKSPLRKLDDQAAMQAIDQRGWRPVGDDWSKRRPEQGG